MAVLSHEYGHLKGHHTEWRILTFLFLPFLFRMVCKEQEFLADKHAAKHGHGRMLINILISDFDGGNLQPSHLERRSRLKQYEQIPRSTR